MTPDQEADLLLAAKARRPITVAGVPYVAADLEPEDAEPEVRGCWVVYYHDRSAVWIFDRDSEIEALRHAVENTATITFWPFGAELIAITG